MLCGNRCACIESIVWCPMDNGKGTESVVIREIIDDKARIFVCDIIESQCVLSNEETLTRANSWSECHGLTSHRPPEVGT
jgi:hypothetical protein